MKYPNSFISRLLFIPLSMFSGFIGTLSGQISAPGSNFSDTVAYPSSDESDMYYIFNTPAVSGVEVYGALRAVAPGGLSDVDFEWSYYDTVAKAFGPPFYSVSNVSFSQVSNLESGGYRVHIQSVSLDTVFRAWVFRNNLLVEVEKDKDGKLKFGKYSCDFIRLNGKIVQDIHYVYDPLTGQAKAMPNKATFEWTSDNADVKIPGPTFWLSPMLTDNFPSKDTWFILTAVDEYNLSCDDSVFYETIHTKADFSLLYEDDEGAWAEDLEEYEAPLKVGFVNKSENGSEFRWSFVDSAKTADPGKEVTYDTEDTLEYTYYLPGYYFPKLISINDSGCVDSFPNILQGETALEIQVDPSKLEVMNVFTPNFDGINDYFIVDARSLKEFRISIYNRYGKLVYQHEQTEEKFDWKGWDGTIDGKGKSNASPGVYFYVIEAIGWDGKKYRGGTLYKGYVYLIRGKDDVEF